MTDLENPKVRALMAHLDISAEDAEDEISESRYDSDRYEAGGAEYLVLTDSEADAAWEEALDQYIDECILPELPDAYRNYFDSESWKRDARFDGRGHALSSYDGEEREEKIDGEWYYIYRVG